MRGSSKNGLGKLTAANGGSTPPPLTKFLNFKIMSYSALLEDPIFLAHLEWCYDMYQIGLISYKEYLNLAYK
jgi:hypothetical protein